MDSPDYLSPDSVAGMNLYIYHNNPVMYKQSFPFFCGSVALDIDFCANSSINNLPVPSWLSTLVGAIPDIILGIKYLSTHGMHRKFVYQTSKRYMHPIVDGTWRWFGKSNSTIKDFAKIAQGSFRQILTGDARAGLGAVAKSFGQTVGLNALINFGFNLYENNFELDAEMLFDTAIDTVIGVSAYYLAAGTVSLIASGLVVFAGVALPGVVVIGGVVILGIGFEHVIRRITDYWD